MCDTKYRKEEIISKIRSSFGWRVKPEHLSESNILTADEKSRLAILSSLTEDQLTDKIFDDNCDLLPLLTGKAFDWFLPRIVLTCSLKTEDEFTDSRCIEHILASLDRPNCKEWYDFVFCDHFCHLTLDELVSVENWLCYIVGQEEDPVLCGSIYRSIETIRYLLSAAARPNKQ